MGVYRPGRPYKYYPNKDEKTVLPEKAGEYRIINKNKKIMYIGETCNLRRRITEHIRTGKIPTGRNKECYVEFMIADEYSDSLMRREHEKQKIKKHKPILNKSFGGEGRIALTK